MRLFVATLAAGTALISATSVSAQSASLVYRLGKDTVAIEQFTRTATGMTGEMVQRSGAAVARYQYTITLSKNGRPSSASIKRLNADGSLPPNAPSDTRFTVTADSIVREAVFADSTQRRAFAAKQAMINFPTFIYGPTELLAGIAKSGGAADSLPALGAVGNLGVTGISPAGGDSVRMRGGAYAMILRFDATNKLQRVDGSYTTNKSIATRGAGGLDIAAIAKSMKPTGTLSLRETARGAFGQGGIVLIDYGRPSVRDRTVWGGALVPFDTVWRTGANDATHLFTSRTLTMGDLVVPPGAYTLFVQHTRAGTLLIVNKQVGQWGTIYSATNDLGRVPMQMTATPSHVEEFTIVVRSMGPTRGAIEMSWGPSMVSVPFTATAVRP
ncbi:DUF2911 domain-containing protein [Gemmatimonas groenlandica]|uniref:DUF2911 domain-containing protein n=1 Tax=Gemmatimonas groenlandica TaxID=2732249 RepID=A0A6M4IQX7_9BACT|nr:DUF2911 domain-containing protein [Gemmatimonas groenlandica]QJR36545.1 DUF2911 domain-containing protein [Gemmatimonas groenlandica]